MDEQENHRRKEDQLNYKIKYLGAIAIALLAIGALISAFGDSRYQTLEKARECEIRLDVRIQDTEKDVVSVKTKLDAINERTKMIWEAVKK